MQARWSTSDDSTLRDRILGGDRAAAEELFQRHLDPLYEFVHYRVGGDRGTAEDVVQDTFLVALERLNSFDGRSTLHTWLCGIAKNKIRGVRRRRSPMLLEDAIDSADDEIHSILASVESEALPEWILERQETQDLVGATLSSLTPEYRSLLLEKYVDERSVKELAAASGRGEKATESALHRARLAFGRVFALLSKRQGGLS